MDSHNENSDQENRTEKAISPIRWRYEIGEEVLCRNGNDGWEWVSVIDRVIDFYGTPVYYLDNGRSETEQFLR